MLCAGLLGVFDRLCQHYLHIVHKWNNVCLQVPSKSCGTSRAVKSCSSGVKCLCQLDSVYVCDLRISLCVSIESCASCWCYVVWLKLYALVAGRFVQQCKCALQWWCIAKQCVMIGIICDANATSISSMLCCLNCPAANVVWIVQMLFGLRAFYYCGLTTCVTGLAFWSVCS